MCVCILTRCRLRFAKKSRYRPYFFIQFSTIKFIIKNIAWGYITYIFQGALIQQRTTGGVGELNIFVHKIMDNMSSLVFGNSSKVFHQTQSLHWWMHVWWTGDLQLVCILVWNAQATAVNQLQRRELAISHLTSHSFIYLLILSFNC